MGYFVTDMQALINDLLITALMTIGATGFFTTVIIINADDTHMHL